MNATNLAKQVYQSFAAGDLDGVLALLSPNVQWEMVGPKSIPYAGLFVGPQKVAEFFQLLFEFEEVIEFQPVEFIGHGNTVAVVGRERCRSKLTGKEYEARWVQIFKEEQGKICSWTEHIDSASIVDAYRLPSTGPF